MINFELLGKNNITTLKQFNVLSNANGLTLRQLSQKTGVSTRGIERMMPELKGLVKRVKYKGPKPPKGKTPKWQYEATKKGVNLLIKCMP